MHGRGWKNCTYGTMQRRGQISSVSGGRWLTRKKLAVSRETNGHFANERLQQMKCEFDGQVVRMDDDTRVKKANT